MSHNPIHLTTQLTLVSETSAHTLCFAFVYLALYPQYQQKVFEELLKVYPDSVPREASDSVSVVLTSQCSFTLIFQNNRPTNILSHNWSVIVNSKCHQCTHGLTGIYLGRLL